MKTRSGGRFSVKMSFASTGIPIIKMRRSYLYNGYPIHRKDGLYIKAGSSMRTIPASNVPMNWPSDICVIHYDVIKWEHLPRYWPFVRGIHRSPVNSPHKGQWRGALMFSSICTRVNGWVNNGEAGDLRRHRAHYDVILMYTVQRYAYQYVRVILPSSVRPVCLRYLNLAISLCLRYLNLVTSVCLRNLNLVNGHQCMFKLSELGHQCILMISELVHQDMSKRSQQFESDDSRRYSKWLATIGETSGHWPRELNSLCRPFCNGIGAGVQLFIFAGIPVPASSVLPSP